MLLTLKSMFTVVGETPMVTGHNQNIESLGVSLNGGETKKGKLFSPASERTQTVNQLELASYPL